MSKKTKISSSSKRALKLKVLAKKKEGVRRRLAVKAEKLRLKAKQLAVTAKKKESIRRRLAVKTAKPRQKARRLAVTALEKESIRRRLAVTAENLSLKAKQLAVTAKERESIRRRLVVTAENLAITAKERETIRRKLEVTAQKLAVTAKEKETIRRKLEVTAEKLAVTAKEKESVRRRLAVTAEKLAVTAKEKETVRRRLVVTAENLAITAKERETIRRKLEVTAENLAVTAKERETIRRKLEVTAQKLAVTAKEKESVRRRLAVTAEKLAVTAKEKETVRRRLAVTAQNLSIKAKQLAVTAKERESVRRRLAVTAENLSIKAKQLAVTALERETIRRKLAVTAKDLEQVQAKNEAMLASIGDGLVATDKNERILLVNKAFERILGWKEEEVRGKLMSKVIPMVDESGKEIPSSERLITQTIKERIITAKETGKELAALVPKNVSGVYYYVRKDKTRFPVAVSVAPVRLEHKIIGTIEVFRDITREKEIDKAKSEFITLASHQLKTPPTAIKLLTERLLGDKMGSFTEKQKEYFEDIHSSNQRMIDLVNALLNVSRIELGAFTVKVNERDASVIVQSILKELKPVVDKKQLILNAKYPDKSVLLMLDEQLFRMVINNLLTNAIHYTAAGGQINILCKVADKGEELGGNLLPESCFVVVISDTGYGVPQKDQGKLFTKFFRADNAREKLTDGTGLGLYIVKSVLDHSGGLIWFTSRENEGSSFYVAIPMTGMRVKEGKKELIG